METKQKPFGEVIEELGREIRSWQITVENRDAEILQLKAELEAVGAGGVQALRSSAPQPQVEPAGIDAKGATLVEILAHNWAVWPAGVAVEQTCLGDVFCCAKGRDCMFGTHEVASDRDSAVVTREQWKEARAALATTPEVGPTSFQVQAITTAYEQGVGKGHDAYSRRVEINNPYGNGYRCDEAWTLGYKEGKLQADRKAKAEVQAEPVAGQSRFQESEWTACSVEHVRMVMGDPRYAAEGYEARYLFTCPQATQQDAIDTELLEALQELVEDVSDRFDMSDQSTNPGLKSAIARGRSAIDAAIQAAQQGVK